MKLKRRVLYLSLITTVIMCLLSLAAKAEEVTLIGEINDSYQLVSDGQLYEIDDTDAGNDLVENYVSQKVKVTGTLREGEDLKILTVKSFETTPE